MCSLLGGLGSEYAQLAYHEFDKKHAEIDQRQSDETNKRMYAEPGKTDCPVSSLKCYISHLHPDQDAFFQRPSQTTHGRWYDNVPVGKCSLGSFMKNLSKDAGLAVVYTNHCARASTVTILKRQSLTVTFALLLDTSFHLPKW